MRAGAIPRDVNFLSPPGREIGHRISHRSGGAAAVARPAPPAP